MYIATSKVQSLGKYGYEFQAKILFCLLTDYQFLTQNREILIAEFFDNNAFKWLAEHLISYYDEYKDCITPSVLEALMQNETDDFIADLKYKIKDILSQENSKDLPWAKNQFQTFAKNQVIRAALIESVDDLEEENYDSIKKRMDNALKAGINVDLGLELDEVDPAHIMEMIKRDTLPYSDPTLNVYTNGGIGIGELHVVLAPSNVGKSWMLANFGSFLYRKGNFIMHYTLEMSAQSTSQRYMSCVTNIPYVEMEQRSEEVNRLWTEYIEEARANGGKLLIKQFPTYGATITDIKNHLNKVIEKTKRVPDLICIDYGDLIKPIRERSESRYEIGEIFAELRGMAIEYNTRCLTLTQSNRSGAISNIVTEYHMGKDWDKVTISDFILTMARNSSVTDVGDNDAQLNLHVAKNRFGNAKITWTADFNTATGRLLIDPLSVRIEDPIIPGDRNSSSFKTQLREKIQSINNKVNTESTVNL